MQQAADAMRKAAASGNAGASAQAQQALDRLKETQRKLERSLSDTLPGSRGRQGSPQPSAPRISRRSSEDIANGVGQLGQRQTRRDQAQRIN